MYHQKTGNGKGANMPNFSRKSRDRLNTCDERLQKVFNEVVKKFDCTILEGHRDERRQDRLYSEGKTKVRYPMGRHNSKPSRAVDVAPYPVDWEDRERFHFFSGYVLGVADRMGITLRWGGDWNMNKNLKDNNFDDLPHFEIRE